MSESKICLTTYIYGDKYQDYIPMLIFSIKKAYPDYSIMLFISEKLRPDLCNIINKLKISFNDFEIIENVFDDCKKMNRTAAQSFRWVLWDERFKTFDYIYFIDADILYMREPIPLHEQHIRHMQFINDKGISNIIRKRGSFSSLKNMMQGLLHNYTFDGIRGIFFYFTKRQVFRFSGLHFVKTSEYYKKISSNILNKYRQYIYDGKIVQLTKYANDEAFLYKMVEEVGWDMSHFAVQSTQIAGFGFNEPERQEFRPHHGIHLGIFRNDKTSLFIETLESDDYKYYIQKFKEIFLHDELFMEIYQILPDNIKLHFERMYRYYGIKL